MEIGLRFHFASAASQFGACVCVLCVCVVLSDVHEAHTENHSHRRTRQPTNQMRRRCWATVAAMVSVLTTTTRTLHDNDDNDEDAGNAGDARGRQCGHFVHTHVRPPFASARATIWWKHT